MFLVIILLSLILAVLVFGPGFIFTLFKVGILGFVVVATLIAVLVIGSKLHTKWKRNRYYAEKAKKAEADIRKAKSDLGRI